jgi:cytochrome d ubiquinol oxidase subunit I
MGGAAITGAFVLAAMGAYYLLNGRHVRFARTSLSIGVVAALVLCLLQIFPTGDGQAKNVADHQPSTFAAMEGIFKSEKAAPLVFIGNPNTEKRKLDSTIALPDALSFLTYKRWNANVRGLNTIPVRDWPSSVPLVYYSYRIMVGLGTILLLIAGLAVLLLWRRKLFESRKMLWALMLSFPFTYIANIAGWTVAEAGRQPWTVFGLQRTADAASPASSVPAGTAIFTLLGFAGLYLLLGILYLMLIVRIVNRGPDEEPAGAPADEPDPEPAAAPAS